MNRSKTGVSIRGLSVVDDQVAWIGSDKGWLAQTVDGGNSWDWIKVPGFDSLDFRSVYAFSKDEVIVMNAGSPLVILKTTNGGKSWSVTHQDENPEIFFDGVDFWDEDNGIAFGDPIDGLMQILVTKDGGDTWMDMSMNTKGLMEPGEAGFAASGTSIRTLEGGKVFIGTGGSRAQLLFSNDYGNKWSALDCPIVQGSASQGIFSMAFSDSDHAVVVGGDYQQDTLKKDVVFLTTDGGETWNAPVIGTQGYRSGVEYVSKNTFVATGTSGVDISMDGGVNWQNISDEGYHVVRKARKGNLILMAGADGLISTLKINK